MTNNTDAAVKKSWLRFEAELERGQSAAVSRLLDELPKVGEPEHQFCTVSTADLRAVLAALSSNAKCWAEGFDAGEGWRRSVEEFRSATDYGAAPAQPANPYAAPTAPAPKEKP
jgi:hypothetical protein